MNSKNKMIQLWLMRVFLGDPVSSIETNTLIFDTSNHHVLCTKRFDQAFL